VRVYIDPAACKGDAVVAALQTNRGPKRLNNKVPATMENKRPETP